jgi:flagellar assembly factor FliW
MKIKTRPYGEVEVDEKQKLHFPEGIIGFEDVNYYYLLDSKEGPFYWLQADGDAGLAFLLVNPRIFMNDYKLTVRKEDLKAIGVVDKSSESKDAETDENLLDFAIVTVPEDHAKMSVNLMGPIVINKKARTAKQMISENDLYTVKHYILEEFGKKKEKSVEKEDARSYTKAQ